MALAALRERISEVFNMACCFPHLGFIQGEMIPQEEWQAFLGVHDHRRVEADTLFSVLNETAPPQVSYCVQAIQ